MSSPQFEFSKIVVLEALADGERKTGREIVDTLRLQLIALNNNLLVEYIQVRGRGELIKALDQLLEEAVEGHAPILHIECHGSPEGGLGLPDDTSLSWQDLAEKLLRINLQTNFNLFVLVSACFGAYFLSMLSAIRPCPCWGIVAPTDTVYPNELESGFSEFYSVLFSTWDLTEAVSALRDRPLQNGYWLSELSEHWFEKILINYFTTYCTPDAMEIRLLDLRTRRENEGLPWMSMKDLRTELRRANEAAPEKYFAVYFQSKVIPGLEDRFSELLNRVERQIQLLDSGSSVQH